MAKKQNKKKSKQPLWITLTQLSIVAALLLLAELVVSEGYVNPIFLASPSQIAYEFFYMIEKNTLLPHLLITLQEAVVGYVIAAVTGVILGVLFVTFPKIEKLFVPFFAAVMAVPKTAIMPLLIVWFGIGFRSKVVMVFLFCMFTVLFNTVAGAKQAKAEHLKIAKVFEASHTQVIFKILLPSALPSIFAGLRVTAATAITGVLFAEMVASRGGAGFLLSEAQQVLNTPELFLVIIIVTIISVLFVALVNFIEYITCHNWRKI